MGVNDVVSLAIFCSTIVVVGVMVLILFRRRTPAPDRRFEADVIDRLHRLEQAIDTIAVEVERVTESQRFVTKLMAERMPERLPAGSVGAERSGS